MLPRWSGVTVLLCLLHSPSHADGNDYLAIDSPLTVAFSNLEKVCSSFEISMNKLVSIKESLGSHPITPTEKEIAITIDDLPFVGSGTNTPASLKRTQDRFMAIVKTLVDNQVPATGFAIGGAVAKNEWGLLELFRNQGFALGNHTYTHNNLNHMNADKYIADIAHADTVLAPVMTEPRYFRFPYLAEGKGEKKQKVFDYLTAHQYTIAPVTIDSKDYRFNAEFYKIPYKKRAQNLEQFKKRYLAYIWKQTLLAERSANKMDGQPVKQILLIHANLLNSLCLEDIIELYKKNGYKFISLGDALKGNSVHPILSSKIH